MSDPAKRKNLQETVEELRSSRYPGLPAELVEAILEAEFEHVSSRGRGRAKVASLLEAHTQKGGSQ